MKLDKNKVYHLIGLSDEKRTKLLRLTHYFKKENIKGYTHLCFIDNQWRACTSYQYDVFYGVSKNKYIKKQHVLFGKDIYSANELF